MPAVLAGRLLLSRVDGRRLRKQVAKTHTVIMQMLFYHPSYIHTQRALHALGGRGVGGPREADNRARPGFGRRRVPHPHHPLVVPAGESYRQRAKHA